MVEFKHIVKFPCGYEQIVYIKGILLTLKQDYDDGDLPLCPLHGKKCKTPK